MEHLTKALYALKLISALISKIAELCGSKKE